MVEGEVYKNWSMHVDGSTKLKERLCVSTNLELRNEILVDAHRAKYEKRHRSICSQLSKFINKWKLSIRNLQGCLPIPKWKWNHITMDFVIGFTRTKSKKKKNYWVIVDCP